MDHNTRSAVPGTIYLVDVNANSHAHNDDIVLNPQPSADPEDPLNWSRKRKLWHVSMIYIYIFGLGITSTVQYSVLTNISEETGIPLASLNTGTGLMFLFCGWGCLIWQPIAMTYGRRGAYVLSSLLTLGPMIWTAYTSTTSQWYAHRILLGLALAPVESLPELSIPDIFFAHERGSYIGLYTLLLFGSNALSPFLAGQITQGMGWRAAIWFGIIVLACTTTIVAFGLEETMYFRHTVEGIDNDQMPQGQVVDDKEMVHTQAAPAPATVHQARVLDASIANQESYLQKLRIFRRIEGSPSNKQMFYMMIRPLIIFFYFPNVVYAGFLYGSNLCMYQVQNATMALILGGAPYNFSASAVGCSYLSLLIGCCLGWAWVGWIGDKSAIYFARRNKGIREPEQRLWILSVSGIIGASGLILWGVGASQGIHFMGLMVGMVMVSFAIVSGSAAAIAYDVDCFKEIAGESLILVMVIRNTMGFGMGYGITPWLQATGVQHTFIAVAFVFLACTFSFLLMVRFGKVFRKAAARKYWEYVDTLTLPGH
jgi:MFS family permease